MIEGFYPFSTHPVTYGPGGVSGVIGIKDIHGNVIADEQYEKVDGFFNGLCAVKKKEGKWGCIDATGTVIIPFRYNEPLRFEHLESMLTNVQSLNVSGIDAMALANKLLSNGTLN